MNLLSILINHQIHFLPYYKLLMKLNINPMGPLQTKIVHDLLWNRTPHIRIKLRCKTFVKLFYIMVLHKNLPNLLCLQIQ